MISWIQDQLAKNGRWIFIALLVLLLIPFVFTIGNTPGFAGAERTGPGAEFYGVDLASRDQVDEWIIDTELGAQMETGRPPFNEQMLQFLVINRIALIHLADQLSIPEPGPREIKEFVPELALFQKPDGSYDNSAYVEFIENFEANPNVSDADIERALKKAYRISKVTELLNGKGFALETEALLAEEVENTSYDIAVAEFDKTAFNPEIEVTDEALQAYYNENLTRYEIAEKVDAAWVQFSIEGTAETLEITAAEDVLATYFDQNRSKYLASKPEDVTEEAFSLADVRDAVEADYLEEAKTERARSVVEEKASALAYDLYTAETTFGSDAFNAVLETYSAELIQLGAVAANSSSVRLGRDMPRELVSMLHELSPEKYFTDAVRLNNGDMGVFFFKSRIPAEIPAFETVQARVRNDYRRAEKDRLFNEKGVELSEQFKAAVEGGEAFSSAVYGSSLVPSMESLVDSFLGGSDLEGLADKEASVLSTFDAVKSNDRREGLISTVTSALTGMEPGEVSPMLTAGSKGYFVYVSDMEVPEVEADSEAVDTRMEQFETRMANSFGRSIISKLIEEGSPDEAQQ
ncbi:MAG: hypothetical protein ACPGN3_06890 [Opitutales bacterium]